MIILNLLYLVIGIYILVKGADFLVSGSTSIARKYNVSSMIIGLTIVAFGTSMPELMVNVISSLKGSSGIALGNIIGSNISNTLLILGIAGMMKTVHVKRSVLNKELPFSIFSILLLLLVIISYNSSGSSVYLSRVDGFILLSFFVLFVIYLFQTARRTELKPIEKEVESYNKMSITQGMGYVVLGIIGLYLGSKWTVSNAVIISQAIGLSEFVISASIIALGTSLPELVTTIVATKSNEIDLAVGNIVGSNIFNILWILGVTSLIKPIPITKFVTLDLRILLAVSIFFWITILLGESETIDKKKGLMYVLLYCSYIIFIFIRN